jgi:hypothetical protein
MMSRGPQSVRQHDLERVLRAFQKLGIEVEVKIDRQGTITATPISHRNVSPDCDQWDSVLLTGDRHNG